MKSVPIECVMIRIKCGLFRVGIAVVFLLNWQAAGEAQFNPQFGKNKVHYKDFEWASRAAKHFDIYFYRGEEPLAERAEQMAERAYRYLSTVFQYEFTEKIPLILYASSDDFQQTEVVGGLLGEGIGGVTESLKGRIVIPFLGSYRYFNHVLVHELVHAFQFDVLNAEGGRLSMFSEPDIPLWFMEGMAEFLSEYRNPLTDMWLYDAVANDSLPSAKKIESLSDIRVYRFGQSLCAYLQEKHGNAVFGNLLREIAANGNWDDALQKIADTSWKSLYEGWLEQVKTAYKPQSPGMQPIDAQAQRLIAHKKDEFALNILPAISPNGKYLAFLSDRDMYQKIYLASAETGKILNVLIEGERRGTFENLRFLNTSIAWSPDSESIAFNAQAGGENAIYLLNRASRKITKKLTPDMSSIGFLAWSPDGKSIAFTGAKHGQEDLFLITIADETVTQLTDDLYTNRHPAWSPDGNRIAFTTDAGQYSDVSALKFGPSNLAIFLLTTKRTQLLTDDAANDFTPVWSPDSSMLAFISDRNGVCNLYLLPLPANTIDSTAAPIQVTNVNAGIVGLTEDNPALSWSKDTGKLVFSGFTKQGWDIFALENPAALYREYAAETGFTAVSQTTSQESLPIDAFGKKDWEYPLPETTDFATKNYRARLTPEYIVGGGGGNQNHLLILARISLSDILSNHRLRIAATLTEVFDESDFLISYENSAHRIGYEIAAFQFGESGGTYALDDDAEMDVEVQRGLGVNLFYPFDKFRRVEFGAEGWMVSGKRETKTQETEMNDQFFFAPMVAYVHDTTLNTAIGPLDGRRLRLSLQPAVGNFMHLTAAADARWYLHLTRRSALAFRAVTIGSFGENARIFEVGGANTFRGLEFDKDDDDRKKIRGTKIFMGNIEYRFPLLPKYNFLRGCVFWDMAVGWKDDVHLFTGKDADFLRFEDLHGAYGVGVRVPIMSPFGILNLRVDLAQQTDLTRNIGANKVLFSIGSDF